MISARQVRKALDEHGDDIGKLPNVVGLGVVNDERTTASKGDCVLAVYVAHKVPDDELAPREGVPTEVEIQYRGEPMRIPTTVIESGEIMFESEGLE